MRDVGSVLIEHLNGFDGAGEEDRAVWVLSQIRVADTLTTLNWCCVYSTVPSYIGNIRGVQASDDYDPSYEIGTPVEGTPAWEVWQHTYPPQ